MIKTIFKHLKTILVHKFWVFYYCCKLGIIWQGGRNPHHYEYWTDNYDSGTTFIKMPYKYVLELVADYLAAGKTYNGKNFTAKQEIDWWNDCKDGKAINNETKLLITYIFESIDEEGFSAVRKMRGDLEEIYHSNCVQYLF